KQRVEEVSIELLNGSRHVSDELGGVALKMKLIRCAEIKSHHADRQLALPACSKFRLKAIIAGLNADLDDVGTYKEKHDDDQRLSPGQFRQPSGIAAEYRQPRQARRIADHRHRR